MIYGAYFKRRFYQCLLKNGHCCQFTLLTQLAVGSYLFFVIIRSFKKGQLKYQRNEAGNVSYRSGDAGCSHPIRFPLR